jgi:hypothetical protein
MNARKDLLDYDARTHTIAYDHEGANMLVELLMVPVKIWRRIVNAVSHSKPPPLK